MRYRNFLIIQYKKLYSCWESIFVFIARLYNVKLLEIHVCMVYQNHKTGIEILERVKLDLVCSRFLNVHLNCILPFSATWWSNIMFQQIENSIRHCSIIFLNHSYKHDLARYSHVFLWLKNIENKDDIWSKKIKN